MLDVFLADLTAGAYTAEWSDDDAGRIAVLVDRYRGLPLDIAGAAVIACAERHGGEVLTRDGQFSRVVGRDPNVRIVVRA